MLGDERPSQTSKIGKLLTTDEGIRGGTIRATKPRDGTGSPPTGLSRLWRSFEPRTSRRASGHQRYYCTLTAPSGSTTPTTIPMAHRYARWRIHRKPPSWLRPRQEVAYSLPSWLNVRHCGGPVKSSIDFLLGLQIPSGSAFPQSMSAHTAVRATPGRMMHTSVIRYGTTKRRYTATLCWHGPMSYGDIFSACLDHIRLASSLEAKTNPLPKGDEA